MNQYNKEIIIHPYARNPLESFPNNNQAILQDLIQSDIKVLLNDIDSIKYWNRRVIVTDIRDYTPLKFFTKWDYSYILGSIKSPIFCEIVCKTKIENGMMLTIEKINSSKDVAFINEIYLNKLMKIPIVNFDESMKFMPEDLLEDSKIIVKLTRDTKLLNRLELYAKSLVEIHEYHYQNIDELTHWNSLRFKVFENVYNKFLTIVIDKGMKKPHYKTLIENNLDYFKDFFRKKVHELINELLKDKSNFNRLVQRNRNLQAEIEKEYKPQILAQKSEKAIKLILDVINKKIDYSNQELLSEELTNIILSSVPMKEQLLKYFNEFLSFLIIF